jgi:hypothetical protein
MLDLSVVLWCFTPKDKLVVLTQESIVRKRQGTTDFETRDLSFAYSHTLCASRDPRLPARCAIHVHIPSKDMADIACNQIVHKEGAVCGDRSLELVIRHVCGIGQYVLCCFDIVTTTGIHTHGVTEATYTVRTGKHLEAIAEHLNGNMRDISWVSRSGEITCLYELWSPMIRHKLCGSLDSSEHANPLRKRFVIRQKGSMDVCEWLL